MTKELELNKPLELTSEEYHGLNYMSYHQLKDFALSSEHWDANRRNKEEKDCFIFGTTAHTAVLEPERFKKELSLIKIKPDVDGRTVEGKQAIADFNKELKPENVVLKKSEFEDIVNMSNKLFARPEFFELREAAKHVEKSFIVDIDIAELICIESECIVRFKFRPDMILKNNSIVDYKTTLCAADSVFANEIKNRKYHAQLALYTYLYSKVTKGKMPRFATIIAQEKKDPHAPNFFVIDESRMDHGLDFVRMCLYKYHDFLINGKKLTGYRTGFKIANFSVLDY